VNPLPKSTTQVLLAKSELQDYGILAAVRALNAAEYAPWIATTEPGTYAARSWAKAGTVSVTDPVLDSERFVCELAAVALRLSVAAVLPCTDSDLFALAGREADFPGIALGVPPRKCVDLATDKGLLPELAATAGLRTPPTKKVVFGGGEAAVTIDLPAIVKPQRSWIRNPDGTMGGYCARYVSTAQAIEEALKALPNGVGLVQQYIPGPNVSVSGVSWGGELICAVHHISERIWQLTTGVSAYAETIPPHAELEQGVSRLLREIGWSGLFEMEFKRSPRGEHYLIDLNPRIYGTLALASAAGLNLPGIWVDLLLNRQPKIASYRVGTRLRVEEKDVRALLFMLVNDGERWRTLRGLVPHRGTSHAVFSLRDPMPSLTSLAKLLVWSRQHYRDSRSLPMRRALAAAKQPSRVR